MHLSFLERTVGFTGRASKLISRHPQGRMESHSGGWLDAVCLGLGPTPATTISGNSPIQISSKVVSGSGQKFRQLREPLSFEYTSLVLTGKRACDRLCISARIRKLQVYTLGDESRSSIRTSIFEHLPRINTGRLVSYTFVATNHDTTRANRSIVSNLDYLPERKPNDILLHHLLDHSLGYLGRLCREQPNPLKRREEYRSAFPGSRAYGFMTGPERLRRVGLDGSATAERLQTGGMPNGGYYWFRDRAP